MHALREVATVARMEALCCRRHGKRYSGVEPQPAYLGNYNHILLIPVVHFLYRSVTYL
jgi:hypothetical protein